MPTRPTRTRVLLLSILLGVLYPASLVASPPASAVISGTVLSGTASSMWQVNSEVDAVLVNRGVIYAAGPFTKVRPPGTNTGNAQEVTRNYLAAFNANTGVLISAFNVSLNARVKALAASPDGTRLYLGGTFTSVLGTTRNRLAALDVSNVANGGNATLVSGFNARANKGVVSVAATASTVYAGGDFTSIGGGNQSNIASLSASTGNLNAAFNPVLTAPPPSVFATYSPRVNAIEVVPDESRVLAGGSFNAVDGVLTGGLVSFDPVTGDSQPWAASASQPINTNCGGRTTDIVTSGTTAFVTAEGDPPGCYEGTYAARISDGQLLWNSPCLGATQGLAVMNGVLYKASHQHDCAFAQGGAFGGFVGGTARAVFVHRYLAGQDTTDGSFVHWTPNTNATSNGGTTSVGPQTVSGDGTNLVVGGDFTKVNGTNQQGLARFTTGGNTATPDIPGRSVNADPWPNSPTTVAMNLPVTVQPTAANTLTVEFPAVQDSDSGTLTYRIYRDNGTNPVGTVSAESWPWTRPVLRFDDTGLAAGSTHSYRVSASDGTLTSSRSNTVSGTVASSPPAPFATNQSNLGPLVWWRLADGGSTASDSSASGATTGQFNGSVSTGASGQVAGNAAVTLDGASGYVSSQSAISAPNAFTEAAWFKTTSVRGGVILAQSDRATGAGGNTDRILTMDNNGNLVFGVKSGPGGRFGVGTIHVRNQGVSWNDGSWHLVVGTYDGAGTASLYVDGWLQGSSTGTPFDETAQANGMSSSYVRAGWADTSAMMIVFGINFYGNHWPDNSFFTGSIDEVSVFDRALTAPEVASMFATGVGSS